MKHTILIVEDNRDILDPNARYLRLEGYEVMTAENLAEAEVHMAAHSFDILVLDILLPDGSGLDFCKRLREKSNYVPILFLSALKESHERIAGIVSGGDDYMVKPYNIAELVVRVAALLRRNNVYQQNLPSRIMHGPLTVDTVAQRTYIDGADAGLSPKEYGLLLFFLQNIGKRFTAEELYEAVWGQDANNDIRTVMVRIAGLRSKLKMDGDNRLSIEMEERKYYKFDINI